MNQKKPQLTECQQRLVTEHENESLERQLKQ